MTKHDVKFLAIVLSAAAVIVGRQYVPGHGLSWPGTYEAFTHIWVGFLLGIVFMGRHAGLRVTAGVVLLVASGYELAKFLSRA